MKKFWYTKEVNKSMDEVIDDMHFSLAEEWFWVLTQIDMKEKIKTKLWKDFEDYIIFWACNPSLAYEALNEELEIWLLLPCNIIVYKKDNKVFVSSIVPTSAMGIVENENIHKIARIAEEKLIKVIDSL